MSDTQVDHDSEREQMLTDWLTTALEGGIGYWAAATEYRWNCPPSERHATLVPADNEDDEFTETRIGLRELAAAMVKIRCGSTNAPARLVGLLVKIDRNLNRSIGWLAMDESSEFDAGDADAVMQIAVCGSVVYG